MKFKKGDLIQRKWMRNRQLDYEYLVYEIVDIHYKKTKYQEYQILHIPTGKVVRCGCEFLDSRYDRIDELPQDKPLSQDMSRL